MIQKVIFLNATLNKCENVSFSAGELLDELLCILSSRNLLTRAALHLLLLPQLTCLSLKSACSLVNGNLCSLIQIRCQVEHGHLLNFSI